MPTITPPSAEKFHQFGATQPGLNQDRAEGAATYFLVQRDDDDTSVSMPRVAPLGRRVSEAGAFQSTNDLSAGRLGQSRTHAGMRISIGVTSG